MTAAYAYTAMGLVIAACIAIGYAITRDGSEEPRLLLRARWAWRCRKPPARTEGKLTRAEHLTFVGLVESWRQPAYGEEPERSRT